MTESEIIKDIEAVADKLYFLDSVVKRAAFRDVILEYRKAVAEETIQAFCTALAGGVVDVNAWARQFIGVGSR